MSTKSTSPCVSSDIGYGECHGLRIEELCLLEPNFNYGIIGIEMTRYKAMRVSVEEYLAYRVHVQKDMDIITAKYLYLCYAKFMCIQKESLLDAEIEDILWTFPPNSRQEDFYQEEDLYKEAVTRADKTLTERKQIREMREEIDAMLALFNERLLIKLNRKLSQVIYLIPKYSKGSPNFKQMAMHHVNSLKICEDNIKPSFINYRSDLDKVLKKLQYILYRLKYRPQCYSKLDIYVFGIRDGECISNGKAPGLVIHKLMTNINYYCKGFQGSSDYPVSVILTGCNMQQFAGRMKNITVVSIGSYTFDSTLTYKKHYLPLMLCVVKSCCNE